MVNYVAPPEAAVAQAFEDALGVCVQGGVENLRQQGSAVFRAENQVNEYQRYWAMAISP
jgi:hypothetical protein